MISEKELLQKLWDQYYNLINEIGALSDYQPVDYWELDALTADTPSMKQLREQLVAAGIKMCNEH